jgi:hypothetical protein
MSEEIGDVPWNRMLEDYFCSTAERAHGLAWLHKRGEEVYSQRRTWIDLPVIIGSGAVAFLNAGSQTLFEGEAKMSSIALGLGSLALGLLNGVGTYFGWSKRAEQHRISALQYERLFRFLSVEMTLPRADRMRPKDLLKMTRDSVDRLAEISPLIPKEILADFRRRFGKYREIAQPTEVNGLERVRVFDESQECEYQSGRLTLRTPREGAREGDGRAESPPASVPRAASPLLGARTGKSLPTRPSAQSEAASSSLGPSASASAEPNTERTLADSPSVPAFSERTHP